MAGYLIRKREEHCKKRGEQSYFEKQAATSHCPNIIKGPISSQSPITFASLKPQLLEGKAIARPIHYANCILLLPHSHLTRCRLATRESLGRGCFFEAHQSLTLLKRRHMHPIRQV